MTMSGFAEAAKKPEAAHAAAIDDADDARPNVAVDAPERAKARTSGSVRPSMAAVLPSSSWPSNT